MALLLNGGGCGGQAAMAMGKLHQMADPDKPILYIPLAMEPELYPSCYQWITEEFRDYGHREIQMAVSGEDLRVRRLGDYAALFLGGGNTYRLLSQLKSHGCLEQLREYLAQDGVIFGGSAGAIVFGENIDTCRYADENLAGLTDTRGLNVFPGVSLLCHYTNEGEEATRRDTAYLEKLSMERTIVALPEEDTILLADGSAQVLGDRPYYVFRQGQRLIRPLDGPVCPLAL